jgi:hypothetical protein
MTAQQVERGSTRRSGLIALGLTLVLLVSAGVPAAKADTVSMACGGSTEYLYYSSLNFYLPFDGTVLQFAYSVGGGPWTYTDWHYSSTSRSSARWDGYKWIWGDVRLSDATAQGQRVVAYVRYGHNPSIWYYVGECGGGEVWVVG